MESHFKTCGKCKEMKPRGEFSKDRRAKDGLRYQCKSCMKRYLKQWHQENREQELEYKKQYYQENRERALEYSKQWHQENREQILERKKQRRQENPEYEKQYYQENREQKLEYFKQWRQDNPEKNAAKSARRRALKRDGIPDVLRDCPIEKGRLEQIYKLRDLLTKAIGIQYHVDHIWPLSRGGPHWSGNLQIITAEENLSKHASFCEDTARVIQESLDEHLSSRQ